MASDETTPFLEDSSKYDSDKENHNEETVDLTLSQSKIKLESNGKLFYSFIFLLNL